MPAKELHPALQYLKDNIVVIGILVILAVSIGLYAISQASASTPQAAPTPAAPEVTAVPLDNALPEPNASSPAAASATPSPTRSTAGNAARGAAPVVGQASGPTAAPQIVAGGAQQAVTAQDWRPTAEAFAAAWANPEGGKDAWLARVKPYATPALAATFAYTDIRNIPTDKLASISTISEASGTVSFKAYYDDGGLLFQGLAIIKTDGSWLVDKVGPPEKK
jgi:hypothetical protein